MATFISKEELLGSASGGQIVKEVGAVPAPAPVQGGISDLLGPQGGDMLDKIDRILTRVDSSLQTVERIRTNPLVKNLVKAPVIEAQARPAQAQLAAPSGVTPPATERMNPEEIHNPPKPSGRAPEFNVEGAKAALADLMGELDAAGEGVKKMTLGEVLEKYKSPIQRGIIEALVLDKMEKNFSRLIK